MSRSIPIPGGIEVYAAEAGLVQLSTSARILPNTYCPKPVRIEGQGLVEQEWKSTVRLSGDPRDDVLVTESQARRLLAGKEAHGFQGTRAVCLSPTARVLHR